VQTGESHFLLDFPEMDEQHRYLYRLFDSLEHTSQVINRADTKTLLGEIERYLMFHFSCEEHLMRQYAFDGFAVHQSDHESAETKFVQFLNDFEATRLNPAALRAFLIGWLEEHSRMSDTVYVAWIKKKRGELFRAL